MRRRAGGGITRRMMLLGVLLPIAGCVTDKAWLAGGRQDLASWLRALAPGWRAAALGARYLRDQPAEKSADWLARRLFDSELSRQLDPAGFHALLDTTNARRARDFVDDDLVVPDGWAVARTEARLLTLIALCAGE